MPEIQQLANGNLLVSIPMRLTCRSGRKRIILPSEENSTKAEPGTTDQAIAIALCRAHAWQALIDDGSFSSAAQLAREIGISATYVVRIIQLNYLAPDIVHALLQGDIPNGLSLAKLTQYIPASWEEQRTLFGFSQAL